MQLAKQAAEESRRLKSSVQPIEESVAIAQGFHVNETIIMCQL